MYASEIDLKLTTSDGSTQVSVVNSNAVNAAAIDSSGNVNFRAALMPSGNAGVAGQVLTSNGPNIAPIWVPPLLASTNTWTAPQTFNQSVTVSSNLIVGGILSGDGSGLSNLQPGTLSGGILQQSVVASSIAVNTVYPAAVTAGDYGTIRGLGNQDRALNMGSNPINSVGGPAADTDAATKAYVDTATGAVSASMITYVDTATGAVSASLITYVDTATGAVSASMITYVDTATGAVSASLKTYVDTATGAVNASVWSSTGNWIAQQTYTKQISVSTSMVLSGSFIAAGSAGSSGNILQSMGSGAAPQWVSTSTFLGGLPILKQGPASLSFAVKSATYTMTSADFAISGDASGGLITMTLPPATNAGMMVMIVKKDSSGNNVNIARGGGDTIEGSATPLSISAQHQKYMLIADGASTWYILSQ